MFVLNTIGNKPGTIASYSKGTLIIPTSSMLSWSVCALLAGFLSAAASLSAKLSLGADYMRDVCKLTMENYGGTTECDWVRHSSMFCPFLNIVLYFEEDWGYEE